MIRRKLSGLIILLLFIVNFFPFAYIQGYKPWGKATLDGSEIQVYWESAVQEKDYRIPEDLTMLETDEFKVWIRSIYFAEGKSDNFTVRLFDYHLETVQYWDSRLNATRTRQEKVFDILKDEITIEIKRGDSPYEWSDLRFGIISINKETFPAFKNVNRTERVQVIFHEKVIEFNHWTNLAEYEITKTYGQFNQEILFWLGCGIVIIFIFILFAYLIHKSAGLTPPPPSWYVWFMLAGVIVGIMFLIALMIGIPIETLTRIISVLPPIWIAVLAGMWLDFYLPNRFSGAVKPYIFLEVDGEKQVLVGIWPLWGYFKGDRLEFVKNKTSYRECGKRLFVGGFPQPDWIFRPKIPILSKNKELPFIFGVRSYKETPAQFKKDIKWYIMVICGILLFSAFIPMLLGIASLQTGVASVLMIIFATCLFVFTSIHLTKPELEIEQILHQSELQVLTNINSVKAMQVFVKETLDEHMKFVSQSEKSYFKRLKASIKRFGDSYRGETKKQKEELKEKLEKVKQLQEVMEWAESEGFMKKSEEETKTPL